MGSDSFKNRPCTDHLGNVYESHLAMCKHYGISYQTFYNRFRVLGWTIERALLSKKSEHQCYYDHLGYRYSSVREMCEHYGVKENTYFRRRAKGWSIEESLLGKKFIDHLGNEYKSMDEMCKAYDIPTSTYTKYKAKGYSTEYILTGKYKHYICDHLGNRFNNVNEMCEYWKIPVNTYNNRIYYLKWSLEKALTADIRVKAPKNEAIDHLGNKFKSIKEMCAYWNVDYQLYISRLHAGFTVERALTRPTKHIITDHLGNEFKSEREMCKYWNIDFNTYVTRKKHHWDLERMLTQPVRKRKSK